MQAIRVHRFGTLDDGSTLELRIDDLPEPAPAAGEVLVEIEAIGVNPADTYVASGTYAIVPELPYTPGADAAGVVKAVGEGVTRWEEGDRVIVTATTAGRLRGCYADTCLCPEDGLIELPGHLSFAQGAAVNVAYVTAFRALIEIGRVKPGESVLIHGATGGVGTAAVQIALAHKLDVWATGGSDSGRKLLEQQGVAVDHILDHAADHHMSRLPERGVDVIIEMLANVNLPTDMAHMAHNGRIVVVGNRGEVTINARQLMGTQASIIGLNYWSGGDAALRRALTALSQGLANGDLKPVVQTELPLARCLDAWRQVMRNHSGGKIVLVP